MYHCGTKPVSDAHRQRHVRGDRRRAQAGRPAEGRPNYVLVASEWYLGSDGPQLTRAVQHGKGSRAPARLDDLQRLRRPVRPASAGREARRAVRFWVVDAGPSLDTDFHIVGTVLNTAYPFGDMNPADALHNVQTVTVPAGGGGVFDVKIDKPGSVPVRLPRLAAVDEGQVGLLNVGGVHGTMSH